MPVDTTTLNTLTHPPAVDLSMLSLILQADIMVKLVMLLLLLGSCWCWAIIFDKWLTLRKLRTRMAQFDKHYHHYGSFDKLYEALRNKPIDNPLTAMFLTAMHECKEGSIKKLTKDKNRSECESIITSRMSLLLQKVKNKSLEKIEKNISFLATLGSAAPFIGLFGTVWGIVNSFQAIAASKNTTLVVVAPGIAEALLATAMGLFAAIPAVIFYNIFSAQLRTISIRLNDFAGELNNVITYHYA